MKKKNILVLCTGNSCRSQMAEGWIRYYAGDAANVWSAGVEAHGLNQFAVRSMMDAVIDISGYKSKTVDELPETDFDYNITVCDNAREACPYIPGDAVRLHHSFPDPAKAEGTDEEKMRVFNSVRDEIEDFAFDFVHTNIRSLIPDDLEKLV